jgi:hypothetical protein
MLASAITINVLEVRLLEVIIETPQCLCERPHLFVLSYKMFAPAAAKFGARTNPLSGARNCRVEPLARDAHPPTEVQLRASPRDKIDCLLLPRFAPQWGHILRSSRHVNARTRP